MAADGTRSLPSNVRKVTISFNAPIPPAPLLVAPPNGASSQLPILLDWADDENQQSYELQIGKDPTFAQANAAECTGVEWCVRGIPESQWSVPSLGTGKFYWRVRSEHGDLSPTEPALSDWSAVRSFTVLTTPPGIQAFSIDVMDGNGLFVRSHTNAPSGTTPDNQVFGRLTLDNRIPPEGAVVSLRSSNPSVASVPASITVPAREGGLDATGVLASFPIEPKQVTTSTPVTITATLPTTGSKSVPLTIDPPSLRRLQVASSVSPVAISGGSTPAGLVEVNGSPPAGGARVTFTSSRPDVVPAPSAVTVPSGSSSAPFTLAPKVVTATTPVTLTASWGSSSVSVDLSVHGPPDVAVAGQRCVVRAGSSGPVRLDRGADQRPDPDFDITVIHDDGRRLVLVRDV